MFHLALDNRGQMEDGGGLGGPGIRCQHGLLILDIYKHHNIAIHGITVLTPATLHTGDTQIHTAGARTSEEEMSRAGNEGPRKFHNQSSLLGPSPG